MLEYLKFSIDGPSTGWIEFEIVEKNGLVGVLMNNHVEEFTEENVLDLEKSKAWLDRLYSLHIENWREEYIPDDEEIYESQKYEQGYVEWDLEYKVTGMPKIESYGEDIFPENWTDFVKLTEELFELEEEEIINQLSFQFIESGVLDGNINRYVELLEMNRGTGIFSYTREFPDGAKVKQEYYIKEELNQILTEVSNWFYAEKDKKGKQRLGKPNFNLTFTFGNGDEIVQSGEYKKANLPEEWNSFTDVILSIMIQYGTLVKALDPEIFQEEDGVETGHKGFEQDSDSSMTEEEYFKIIERNSIKQEEKGNIIEVDFKNKRPF